ncbi:MAG: hypothetical protein LM568_03810 [Desulfurococcaceae archaeon]|nr:hypothetical protein [Desulfurococcaceae archaeon]
MSIDPLTEAQYSFRLTLNHLQRAEKMLNIGDYTSTIHFAQLAVENFVKTVITFFEISM